MNKGRVYLGLVDSCSFPDEYKEYIWASDSCINGISCCQDMQRVHQTLSTIWTEECVKKAEKYLEKIREKIIVWLGSELNLYLGLRYTFEEWELILNSWLREYLVSYYDKYLKLLEIDKRGIYADCYILLTDEYYVPVDYIDYTTRSLNEDSYNLYQYSRLINEASIRPNGIQFIFDGPYHSQNVLKNKVSKKEICKEAIYNSLNAIDKLLGVKPYVNIMSHDIHFTHRFLMQTYIRSRGKVLPTYINYVGRERNSLLNISPDKAWREASVCCGSADGFLRVALGLIKKDIPLAYVEGHSFLMKEALNKTQWFKPKTIICGPMDYTSNEVAKLYMSKMKNKGTNLHGTQHGGNYGVENFWHYRDEIHMSDAFYTWGWLLSEEEYSCKFKPMPSLKLMRHKRIKNRKNKDIIKDVLYVGDYGSRYIGRFMRMELYQKQFIEDEVLFFKKMPNELLKRITFRPYPKNVGRWGVSDKMKKEIPELRQDTIADFYQSIVQYRLVILSDWITSFNEVLYANIPFLLLRDLSFINKEALPTFNILYKVGLLCTSFEELSKRLTDIIPKVEEWWENPERQRAVQLVRESQSWCPPNSEKLWMEELMDLSEMKKIE